MNRERRARIAAAQQKIEDALALLSEAKGELEDVKNEEQDALDNLPQSLQDGDRGQAMSAAVDALDTAITDLDALVEGDVISTLEEAAQ